jgi:4'-phosphopantetheinyl transferase
LAEISNVIEWLIQCAADSPWERRHLDTVETEFFQKTRFPEGAEGLLGASETAVYNSLACAKRRGDWLLGRWTAKKLVQAVLDRNGERRLSLSEISILAATDGAPQVWLGEEGGLVQGDFRVSISHSRDVSLCAFVANSAHLLGADIEWIEPRSQRFADEYFTSREKESVRCAPPAFRDSLITAVWSAKEAALKAVRQGLRVDTRSVECVLPYSPSVSGKWIPFAPRWCDSRAVNDYPPLSGWWRIWQGFVLTLVVGGPRR